MIIRSYQVEYIKVNKSYASSLVSIPTSKDLTHPNNLLQVYNYLVYDNFFLNRRFIGDLNNTVLQNQAKCKNQIIVRVYAHRI